MKKSIQFFVALFLIISIFPFCQVVPKLRAKKYTRYYTEHKAESHLLSRQFNEAKRLFMNNHLTLWKTGNMISVKHYCPDSGLYILYNYFEINGEIIKNESQCMNEKRAALYQRKEFRDLFFSFVNSGYKMITNASNESVFLGLGGPTTFEFLVRNPRNGGILIGKPYSERRKIDSTAYLYDGVFY